MAAKAIVKKIYENPQALSMIRILASPGIDGTTTIIPGSEVVKAYSTTTAVDETKTTEDRGEKDVNNKVKTAAAVVSDDAWKMKSLKRIEKTGLKLLQQIQKFYKDREEDEMFMDSNDKLINYMKPIKESWSKRLEEEERILLQEGWTQLRDLLRSHAGLKNCHQRFLLSIQHHHGSGGGEENLKFAVASPYRGVTSVRRLPLRRPGPYGLPRQVVHDVVCITTKDAFLLYNSTTGEASPWIETTVVTQKEKAPRRKVESIALGFDSERWKHKVVCISSNVKKKSDPETENEFLVAEVLTVRDGTWGTGEHHWRKLEFAPRAFEDAERLVFEDGPLYLDGKIHWRCHYERKYEYILKFDIERESFVYTPISRFLIQEFMDSSKHVRSMMMEVDGKVAILKSTSDEETTSSLWICHAFRGGRIEWSEEKVPIPYAYVCPGVNIEALSWTDLIFVQSHRRISYYNRTPKVSLSLKVPTSRIRDHFDCGRIIQL